MNERIKSLYPSLVGVSTEFRFKDKSATPLDGNIIADRNKIQKDVSKALLHGGKLCVMLLAELTAFYRRETYYMAVRSAIEMRRYRPAVLEYLKLSVDERAKELKNVLSKSRYTDKDRDLKVSVAKYFLSIYPNRLYDFKKLLTKEEFITVA